MTGRGNENRFGLAVVCGRCLETLSLTINETLKWLSALPGLG